jgi:predicted unusual protein kinase regulating ubiquinone biosynthesis (AarF/ABC1/UbiB family)
MKTPTSKFQRTKAILSTATKIGAKKAFGLGKRAFLSKEDKRREKDKIDSEIGKLLFENISLLKGTAIKIAQALSLYNLLPPNIQKELSKSYNAINPINKSLVIKIIKNEFGKPYQEIFKKFELKPFASASLGQVHYAILESGEEVAVKIQYPAISNSIKSDINLIRKFSNLKKSIAPIIDEVEEKLYEEIDYEIELKNTEFARENLSSKDIIVPKTFQKYSTKHILTTEYIKGLDLYSWLRLNPSAKLKKKIADNIFLVFTKSIFELNRIQADPNPANYIITPDSRLALIDFGCVKRFNREFVDSFKYLLKVYKSNNRDEILKAYRDIGFIDNLSNIDDKLFEQILKFNRWSIEPFLQEEYRFTKEYLKEGIKFLDFFTKKPFKVVRDYVFIDRTMHGLFSLFEQMEVSVDMRYFKRSCGI